MMMWQPVSADAAVPVSQSPSIIYGLLAVAIGQLFILIGQWVTARSARIRDRETAAATAAATQAAAITTANGIAAAAKLVDDRANRDRQWLVEDRKSLASDLAAKVQATADALAAKQAVDMATLVATSKQHADLLANSVKSDGNNVAATVEEAKRVATLAVTDLKQMVEKVGEKADAAYQEANHVNIKISNLNTELLRVKTETEQSKTEQSKTEQSDKD